MKAVCFEPFTGASGDMILASLFDLGADPALIQNQILSMDMEDFELTFIRKPGIDGIMYGFCDVEEAETEHTHDHKDHTHNHDSHSGSHHHHHHRRLRDILKMIDKGDFPERAKDRAAAVFRRLAEAEGAVHGVPPQDVHFHEVGALDSIVDIVGVCLALEELEVDNVYVSAFKIGHGTVDCEHGTIPVPAPATACLLEGFDVIRLNLEAELTTPTGAALLTTLSDGSWNDLQCRLIKVGTGHGSRQFQERPNILRAYLTELPAAQEAVEMIECEIDDQTPEMTALLSDHLRERGALDVTVLPAVMKKNRSGIRLSVISPIGLTDELSNEILGHSSSIGVRICAMRRVILPRSQTISETPWGPVQSKRIERPTGIEIVPEAEACKEIGITANIPPRRVADKARKWEDYTDPSD